MELPSLALASDFLAGQDRKRCNCMCSGNARMWYQLCSPGESNSDHQVLRSPSDAPDSTVSSFIPGIGTTHTVLKTSVYGLKSGSN